MARPFDPRFSLAPRIDLLYHVLAHVDLVGDVANLHHPGYVTRMSLARARLGIVEPPDSCWIELAAGLGAGPNPGLASVLPLLGSAEGALASAAAEERALHERLWSENLAGNDARVEDLRHLFARHAAGLSTLAEALPSLFVTVHPCPSLPPGGRAVMAPDGGIRVAVALSGDTYGAFFQTLHELTHFVTDDEASLRRRSTRAAGPGFRSHVRLERAAHRHDLDLFSRISEEMRLRYVRWAGRAGLFALDEGDVEDRSE